MPADTVNIGAALDEACSRLNNRRSGARLDAEVMLAHLLGMNRTELYARARDALDGAIFQDFMELVERRLEGVPIAYLVGSKEFYSRKFWVSPAVLIPRPETEGLVEEGVRVLERQNLSRPRILDVGTGSGVVAITLALEFPLAQVVALDVDPMALEQAEENADFHGVSDRIRFEQSDLFEHFKASGPQTFDLIISNPPYVGTDMGPRPEPEVVRYEPNQALFSGCQGLDLIERLISEGPDYLTAGGYLVIELAPFQAERVEAWMLERGFQQTKIAADLSGLPRVVSGRWERES